MPYSSLHQILRLIVLYNTVEDTLEVEGWIQGDFPGVIELVQAYLTQTLRCPDYLEMWCLKNPRIIKY